MATPIADQLDTSLENACGINFPLTPIPHGYLKFRRITEVLLVILLLPLILLVSLLVACLIAFESKGNVLFIQTRPGKNGNLFKMVKFRTMYQNSSQEHLTVEGDQRITSIGAHLRKYRLDEIPQFWNVLRGDMSLIGPRPVPYNFYKMYLKKLPGYGARHIIRPGITGLAQVRLGYTNTLQEEHLKLQYDLIYINNISFKTDVLIIWNTILNVLRGRN